MLGKLLADPALEVAGLMTTFTEKFDRVSMHAVRSDLVRRQAAAVGVPLWPMYIPTPCSDERYRAEFADLVAEAVAMGVTHMAFGDLYLADVRAYREELLGGSGLTPLFPLFGSDTRELVAEMADADLRAVITAVDPRRLDRSIAGKPFGLDLVAEFPPNIDPCGENGEFHTFAWRIPASTADVEVRVGEILERDGFVFADVIPTQAPLPYGPEVAYSSEPGVVNSSPVSRNVFRPERIIGQPP
jgi:diphthamide synthase (EF-2-diphthine--ammonia ligase)